MGKAPAGGDEGKFHFSRLGSVFVHPGIFFHGGRPWADARTKLMGLPSHDSRVPGPAPREAPSHRATHMGRK